MKDTGERLQFLQLKRRIENLKNEIKSRQIPGLEDYLNSVSGELNALLEKPNSKQIAGRIEEKIKKIEKEAKNYLKTLKAVQNGSNSFQIDDGSRKREIQDIYAIQKTGWVRWYDKGVDNWIKQRASTQELSKLKNELCDFLLKQVYAKGRLHYHAILSLSSNTKKNGKVDIIHSQNEGKSSKYQDSDMAEKIQQLDRLFATLGVEGRYTRSSHATFFLDYNTEKNEKLGMEGRSIDSRFELKVTDPELKAKLVEIIYRGRLPQTGHPLYISVNRSKRSVEARYGGYTALCSGDTGENILRIALSLENEPYEQYEKRLQEYPDGERIEIRKKYW